MINKMYKITIMTLLLIVLLLFVIDYFLGLKTVEVKYEPKQELASLVENIDLVELAKEEKIIKNNDIVFDGLTLEELGEKLEKFMTSTLDGYGYKFASYAISLGLDPYLCLAIVLEETGCTWGCSGLVNSCNNIGGQKGSGCGEYQRFSSIDAGIEGFLNNIYKNYYLYGLTTADTMNPKYAENPLWARNVNAYISKIKNG